MTMRNVFRSQWGVRVLIWKRCRDFDATLGRLTFLTLGGSFFDRKIHIPQRTSHVTKIFFLDCPLFQRSKTRYPLHYFEKYSDSSLPLDNWLLSSSKAYVNNELINSKLLGKSPSKMVQCLLLCANNQPNKVGIWDCRALDNLERHRTLLFPISKS